ncbi:MAG: tRNA (N6-isopentenyl adenosine(37)-C2)-methylthiotransferase MiaB [Firmicutes bacterium]|nr:tRNA (N6-isopentenyl adenosine(37)-C2)-methylthiotransferase MiaB [Erysipelotrichaceae bacterium]MDD6525044.1 tRNA (N6-isopentenyl adenosine(37)-C2)-methylthiotransferase MiaB [Bacillota bacterium]MDD7228271.1 tRNA (N6-isopentenyl adenosine(37)-C2)-methylthiotransferase MiaB [Bacillota bacterium]MDY4972254.1 tRNA (N6-isopentenyl adenosine(37)-C2)-methylthiotransferase MiaB [Erysipelotrichaceae bacterium]MDY5997113.1 tRNA (N6-isopentenyl adenosine(37)-C2)-methylthiotransferase MiaB [Erysipelo
MEKFNNILPDYSKAKVRSNNTTVIKREIFDLPDQIKNIGIGRKYYLRTYGCQANERDSETIAGILEALNFTRVDNEEEADVLFFNTCAIRKNAEDKVLGEIGMLKKLKRNNPDLIFALCGCMAQEEMIVKTILEKYPQVDLIFGTHNIHRLPWLLYNAMMAKEKTVEVYSKEGEVVENLPVSRFGKHKAWVNIMYGCDKFCTYCIVPYTRGKQRSRLMEDILKEVRQLKEDGYKEVCLLGQNVNAYGKDLGIEDGFAKLLEEVAKTNIDRIRFSTSHPRDFSENMVYVMKKYPNIMPSLHLPVQSGNNEVLRRMGRVYTVEHYKHLVDLLKKEIPTITFSTDIIVGFPNETHEQFLDTLALVDYCQYDLAYTFIYSPRENTPAAKMEDNISEKEKSDRLQMLNEKITYYSNLNNQKYLHKTLKVLVDGYSKKNKNVYSGYSEENKLVNFTGDNINVGDIVDVYITEVKSYSLNGVKEDK